MRRQAETRRRGNEPTKTTILVGLLVRRGDECRDPDKKLEREKLKQKRESGATGGPNCYFCRAVGSKQADMMLVTVTVTVTVAAIVEILRVEEELVSVDELANEPESAAASVPTD